MLIRGVDDLMHFGVLLSVILRWAVSRFPYSGNLICYERITNLDGYADKSLYFKNYYH